MKKKNQKKKRVSKANIGDLLSLETKTSSSSTKSQTKVTFTDEQLRDCVLDVQTKFERSQIPFIVLGDISRQIKSDRRANLDAEIVHVGVKKRYLNKSLFNILLSQLPVDAEITQDRITYQYKGVPVRIDILTKDYTFLENPDTAFYYIEQFYIPNPFDEYWKVRGLVG